MDIAREGGGIDDYRSVALVEACGAGGKKTRDFSHRVTPG